MLVLTMAYKRLHNLTPNSLLNSISIMPLATHTYSLPLCTTHLPGLPEPHKPSASMSKLLTFFSPSSVPVSGVWLKNSHSYNQVQMWGFSQEPFSPRKNSSISSSDIHIHLAFFKLYPYYMGVGVYSQTQILYPLQ